MGLIYIECYLKKFVRLLRIDKNINDKDLKDLIHKILVDIKDVNTKLISWDDYFNHNFFKIDKFDFDNFEQKFDNNEDNLKETNELISSKPITPKYAIIPLGTN